MCIDILNVSRLLPKRLNTCTGVFETDLRLAEVIRSRARTGSTPRGRTVRIQRHRGPANPPLPQFHASLFVCGILQNIYRVLYGRSLCVITAEISVFDLGIMRIWGRNEVAVRMWLYLEVGVSV